MNFFLHFVFTLETNLFCKTDSDCFVKLRPDVHSMYCVKGKCTKLLQPGEHCTTPTQCASHSFYGPLACSAKCKVENECILSKIADSTYCCLGIPENKKCNPTRPSYLSGCGLNQTCMSKNNHYVCSQTNQTKIWIFGAFLSITGNILINTGINIQKKSYEQNYMLIYNTRCNMFFLGMCIYVTGKIFGYLSYIFGNQSLIAALSATGLVSNSVLAPLINKEVFTYKDALAIIFVFSGTLLILLNNKSSHKEYSLCELLKLYQKPSIIIYFLFLILGIVVFYTVIKYIEANSRFNTNESHLFKQENVWFDDDCFIMKYCMIFFYVLLSAFIASFTTLSIKSLSEIVQKTYSGENQFNLYTPYFFVLILVLCTYGQIHWLNRGLQRFDALLVVPIFHITWTLLSIITAGIYFQEFEHYNWIQFRRFIIGVCIILMGSLFLSTRIVNKHHLVSREEKLD